MARGKRARNIDWDNSLAECARCNEMKHFSKEDSSSEFSWNKDLPHSYCKPCKAEYVKDLYSKKQKDNRLECPYCGHKQNKRYGTDCTKCYGDMLNDK